MYSLLVRLINKFCLEFMYLKEQWLAAGTTVAYYIEDAL